MAGWPDVSFARSGIQLENLHQCRIPPLTHPPNIHSKSEQIGGDLLLSTEKLAEKVRISGQQNVAINVRLS